MKNTAKKSKASSLSIKGFEKSNANVPFALLFIQLFRNLPLIFSEHKKYLHDIFPR